MVHGKLTDWVEPKKHARLSPCYCSLIYCFSAIDQIMYNNHNLKKKKKLVAITLLEMP